MAPAPAGPTTETAKNDEEAVSTAEEAAKAPDDDGPPPGATEVLEVMRTSRASSPTPNLQESHRPPGRPRRRPLLTSDRVQSSASPQMTRTAASQRLKLIPRSPTLRCPSASRLPRT